MINFIIGLLITILASLITLGLVILNKYKDEIWETIKEKDE